MESVEELEELEALHQAKDTAHKAFDILWKSGGMNRTGAYRFLSRRMGVAPDQCHISLFNLAQCARVVELCKPFAALEKK